MTGRATGEMEGGEQRARVLELLGRFPETVAPQTREEAVHEAQDHTRTLVSYQVEPGERITAWLLRPRGLPPEGGWPAIVACHQHAGNFAWGKSEPAGLTPDGMYHYGLELCRHGYVVICPDHLCFEDRRTPAHLLETSPDLVDAQYELFELTSRLLHGSCLQAKYLHDLRAAVGLVAGLPEVDGTRLGTIGHSLGGQEALWLTWFDPRIRAGVSSCGFAPLRDILAAGINHNKAMYVPGLLDVADIEDILAGLAPRPFLLTSGEKDRIFPIEGVRRMVTKARGAYRAAGASASFEAILFPEGHSFPEGLRRRAYAFLDEHVKAEGG
ncbi:MAG: dienelactone hydrolase family protein [Candidatus Dormibacteraeota bacterium]|nr:dienelactone hydrolase family protein [Candidatus Dormibacteraeota bacterium]